MAAAWDRPRLVAATADLLRERGDDVRRHLVTDVVDFEQGPDLLRDIAAHRRPVLTAVLRMPEG
jgi:hypothetical protein